MQTRPNRTAEYISFAFVTVACLVAVHLYVIFYAPASRLPALRLVSVPKGVSFRAAAEVLEKAGVIQSAGNFVIAARLTGAYKTIQAGEYELNAAAAPKEILDMLVKGKVKNYRVQVPEGFDINAIAAAVKEAGLIQDEAQFRERAMDKKFAGKLGFEGEGLEGYLFPDTYAFTKDMTIDEMLTRMAGRFKEVYYKEIDPEARKRGMSMKKLVTLASIIEKETGAREERPLISAVFHNRLKKGIKLQSDPTVIYAIKGFDGNLTKKQLLTKTAYNTYAIYGLPPGPIASPGKASLMAALNPAGEDYLYFVSRNDGTHYFSKSLKEHNQAVNLYQRGVPAGGAKSGDTAEQAKNFGAPSAGVPPAGAPPASETTVYEHSEKK